MLAAWCPRRLRQAMRALLCPLRPCAALGQLLWRECVRAFCGCWTPADRCVEFVRLKVMPIFTQLPAQAVGVKEKHA